VIVKAQLIKAAAAFLSANSRFWVVSARVSASSVTGLGTVFSGAFINIDPGAPGKKALHFEGLEEPPIVTTWEKGRHFDLQAERKGSLDVGAPVYYRQIEVGRGAAYNLAPDGTGITFKVFIRDPYPAFVRENTRFWNASGIDVKLDARGIQVNTESFVSMLVGGVAFDVIEKFGPPAAAAPENQLFRLFPHRQAAQEETYTTQNYYLLHFTSSVRGLSPGAPVEFRGVEVGHVVDFRLDFDVNQNTFDIPVLIVIQPERIHAVGGEDRPGQRLKRIEAFVEKGLRAQLRSGSIVTGQQYVALEFFPDEPPAKVGREGRYPSIPTLPTQFEEIGTKLNRLFAKLEDVPIDQIGSDLRDAVQGAKRITNAPELMDAVKSLTAAVKEIQGLTAELRTQTAPEITAALQQAQAALAASTASLQSDSPLQIRMKIALEELAASARALRVLADFLERQPGSLLRGKETNQ
jgi:paraquat-inducible protein B